MEIGTIRNALYRVPQRVEVAGAGTAAVAALLTPELELLFIRRAQHPRDPWSGHLSFPGGRQDDSDPDALATALRETWEEVGLEVREDWLLGELDPVRTLGVQPPLVIRPFVFAMPDVPRLELNNEVESVHYLGLDALLAGHGRGTMVWRRRGLDLTLPRVDFDGVRLWGLTLQMVDDLLGRLRAG